MEKLKAASTDAVNKIQEFVSASARTQYGLVEEADRLAKYDAEIKEREAAVSSIELGEQTREKQEQRKEELSKLQADALLDLESSERAKKTLAEDKLAWEKQKESDQKGIDNDRQDIRNQNAALAKDRAEYKDKVLKQLKVGV